MLPHQKVINNLQVKVNDGAETNILLLDSFRSMFPHTLNEDGYPRDGFLLGLRTLLQCYNNGKLTNHGKITLELQHYTDKSFQDHQFYVVEMQTWKEIIVGHPASVRLGLIKVLHKNITKTVDTIESNNLSNIKNIDGKGSHRQSKSEPGRGSNWIKHLNSSKSGTYTSPMASTTEMTETSGHNISKGSF